MPRCYNPCPHCRAPRTQQAWRNDETAHKNIFLSYLGVSLDKSVPRTVPGPVWIHWKMRVTGVKDGVCNSEVKPNGRTFSVRPNNGSECELNPLLAAHNNSHVSYSAHKRSFMPESGSNYLIVRMKLTAVYVIIMSP